MTGVVVRTILFGFHLAMFAATPAVAGPNSAESIEQSAQQLSAYQAGTAPVERSVLAALANLERHGTPAEVALLRDVQAHENRVLANLAERAITAIRTRQRDAQRRDFSEGLSRETRVAKLQGPWRAQGLGPTEASCAAYAEAVLGAEALGDGSEPSSLTARELEDRGRIREALRLHALLAAAGEERGVSALRAYGVDHERLLLGMLHTRATAEPAALETLVRGGERLTVRVLAERVKRPAGSEQALAADALGRMLIVELRRSPLAKADRDLARRTLSKAARMALPEVQVIVREALAGASAPTEPDAP